MIAACPRCSTRFRVGTDRLRDEGVRLRCTQCQAVFRVYPPHAAAPRRRDDPTVEAELTPPPQLHERERLVLVADPDSARAKACAAEAARLGLHPLLAHDGVEALLVLQRQLPARALIDASLPRLTGAELCEVVKRNESLRPMHLVFTGTAPSIASLGALRAAGLGPDATVEHADLPDGIGAALRVARAAEAEAQGAPEPAAAPTAGTEAVQPPVEPTPMSVEPGPDPEIARAERLARIVVSDIVLYHAETFERAAREGDVLQALAAEVEEGRTLFRQRIAAHICEQRDFLTEELLRVARTRTPH